MSSLAIALTCNHYPPEFYGGTERVVQALARTLKAAGERVIVIAGSDQLLAADGDGYERSEDGEVPVYRLRRRPDETYDLDLARPRLLAQLEAILLHEEIDVLHVHHWSHLSDHQVRHAAGIGIPSVVTLHDMWTTCPRFFRAPPSSDTRCPVGAEREPCVSCIHPDLPIPKDILARRFVDRDASLNAELEAARAITVPSQFSRSAVQAFLSSSTTDRVRVVPHGLLDEHDGEFGPLGLPLRVGTFGNLNEEKGVLLLIEAMAGMRAELHLYGRADVAFREAADACAAQHGVRPHWHGGYDPVDRHPAADLDLAVFPSLCHETYGLVVDEALDRGTPVVVSEAGALPERVVAGGGLSVPMGAAAELAETIRGLVEDRDAYHLLRASIPTSFPTIAAAAEDYRILYRQARAQAEVQP